MLKRSLMQNNPAMYSFGYTALVNKDNEAWIGSIGKEILEIEDSFSKLIINYKDNKDIQIRIKPPFYKYILNYLLWNYKDRLGIEDEDIGARAREIFSDQGKLKSNDLVEKISTLVHEDFKENGLSTKNQENFDRLDFTLKSNGKPVQAKYYRRSDIRDDILLKENIERKTMLTLSFGLAMDLETTNIFLRKVIGEEGLNFWNEDEFIIYLVKKYYDGRVEKCIEFKEMYKTVSADQVLSQDTVDNENTVELMDIFSEFLEKTKDGDNLNIEKVLAAYKYINQNEKDRQRSIVNRFTKAYNGVENTLAYDIISFKKNQEKAKDKSKTSDEDDSIEDKDVYFEGMNIKYHEIYQISLYPKLGKKVRIKKGDEIYTSVRKDGPRADKYLSLADKLNQYKLGLDQGKFEEKKANEFVIRAVEEYEVQAKEYIDLDIKVRSKKKFERKANTKFLYFKDLDSEGEDLTGAFYFGLDEENIDSHGANYYQGRINCRMKASDIPIEAGDVIYYGEEEFVIIEDLPRINYLKIKAQSEEKEAKLDSLSYKGDKDYYFWSDNEDIGKMKFESFSIDNHYKDNLLTFLYNDKALTTFKDQYFENLNINSDKFNQLYLMLNGQKISDTLKSYFKNSKAYKKSIRSEFISILFLEFVVEANNEVNNFSYKERLANRTSKEIKADYLRFMNNELRKVGMYEYNLSNTYEDLLARIVCADNPLETYRQVWGLYTVIYDIKQKERKKKKEKEKEKNNE